MVGPRIEFHSEGVIDDRDCAFPQVAVAEGGTLVCAYSDGGGQYATGGTGWARSTDLGRTWTRMGSLLAPGDSPPSSNFLKASSRPGGRLLYAYGGRASHQGEVQFGDRELEAVFCRSGDGGRTWSEPETVPMPTQMLEISHGILPLDDGRLLAPAATIDEGRLGERILVAVSDDDGATWPAHRVVMEDPAGENGYLEQKLADLGDGRLLATAWTVTLGEARDLPNSFTVSFDRGDTWTAPASIGVRGQTLSVHPLGGDRLLLLYNRRYGQQGIVAALATMTESDWPIHDEQYVFNAQVERVERHDRVGVEEMTDFTFGFPTAVPLSGGEVLVTYWSGPPGSTEVRWARLRVCWPSEV